MLGTTTKLSKVNAVSSFGFVVTLEIFFLGLGQTVTEISIKMDRNKKIMGGNVVSTSCAGVRLLLAPSVIYMHTPLFNSFSYRAYVLASNSWRCFE